MWIKSWPLRFRLWSSPSSGSWSLGEVSLSVFSTTYAWTSTCDSSMPSSANSACLSSSPYFMWSSSNSIKALYGSFAFAAEFWSTWTQKPALEPYTNHHRVLPHNTDTILCNFLHKLLTDTMMCVRHLRYPSLSLLCHLNFLEYA